MHHPALNKHEPDLVVALISCFITFWSLMLLCMLLRMHEIASTRLLHAEIDIELGDLQLCHDECQCRDSALPKYEETEVAPPSYEAANAPLNVFVIEDDESDEDILALNRYEDELEMERPW